MTQSPRSMFRVLKTRVPPGTSLAAFNVWLGVLEHMDIHSFVFIVV